MSNEERLIVWNIVRNSTLWSDVVFKKGVIFHEFDFKTSGLGCFFVQSYLATPTTNRAQIFKGFLCIMLRYVCICWDTASEKTGLWQLPIVSSAFKLLPERSGMFCSNTRWHSPLSDTIHLLSFKAFEEFDSGTLFQSYVFTAACGEHCFVHGLCMVFIDQKGILLVFVRQKEAFIFQVNIYLLVLNILF